MGLTAGFGAAACLASPFAAAAAGYLGVAAMFAFIVTVVVAMHEVNDGLAVKALTGDSLTLTGVSRKFAAAAGGPARGGCGEVTRGGASPGPYPATAGRPSASAPAAQ